MRRIAATFSVVGALLYSAREAWADWGYVSSVYERGATLAAGLDPMHPNLAGPTISALAKRDVIAAAAFRRPHQQHCQNLLAIGGMISNN